MMTVFFYSGITSYPGVSTEEKTNFTYLLKKLISRKRLHFAPFMRCFCKKILLNRKLMSPKQKGAIFASLHGMACELTVIQTKPIVTNW